jgi:hypothetical protein
MACSPAHVSVSSALRANRQTHHIALLGLGVSISLLASLARNPDEVGYVSNTLPKPRPLKPSLPQSARTGIAWRWAVLGASDLRRYKVLCLPGISSGYDLWDFLLRVPVRLLEGLPDRCDTDHCGCFGVLFCMGGSTDT